MSEARIKVSMTYRMNLGNYQHLDVSASEDFPNGTLEEALEHTHRQLTAWMDKTGLKPKVTVEPVRYK